MSLVEALAEIIENEPTTSYSRTGGNLTLDAPLGTKPDKAARVRVYDALEPRLTHGIEGPSYMYPRAQIQFRGDENDAIGPETDAKIMYLHMSEVKNITVAGHRLVGLTMLDYPILLEIDENLRRVYFFNVQIEEGRL